MNIVCIVGSPHGLDGNSFRLTQSVIEGARREGAMVQVLPLHGVVLPCNGCDSCHRVGHCPQEDGFNAVREVLEMADGVILVSPNYLDSVSAQLKAFMDRCCGVIHCLSFEGKYGVSVVTSGGGQDEQVTAYMNRFLMMTGIRPVGGVHAAMAGALPGGEFTTAVRERALRLGEDLVQAWREQRADIDMDQQMVAYRERMRQLIVWKREDWPYEYSYWQEHHGTA